jgi:hypothetical protein
MIDDIFKTMPEESKEDSLHEKTNISDYELHAPELNKITRYTNHIDVKEKGETIRFLGAIYDTSFNRRYTRENNCELKIYAIVEISKKNLNSEKETIWTYNNYDKTFDDISATELLHGTIISEGIQKFRFVGYRSDLQKKAKYNNIFITKKLLDNLFNPLEEKLKEQYMLQAKKEQKFIEHLNEVL